MYEFMWMWHMAHIAINIRVPQSFTRGGNCRHTNFSDLETVWIISRQTNITINIMNVAWESRGRTDGRTDWLTYSLTDRTARVPVVVKRCFLRVNYRRWILLSLTYFIFGCQSKVSSSLHVNNFVAMNKSLFLFHLAYSFFMKYLQSCRGNSVPKSKYLERKVILIEYTVKKITQCMGFESVSVI